MNNQKLAVLLAALVILIVVLFVHLWRESQPREPGATMGESAPDPVAGDAWSSPDSAGSGAQAPPSATSPPSASADNVATVVHLKADGFQPVNFDIRATSFPLNLSLTQSQPESIHAGPRLRSLDPWFGVLQLGRPTRDYPFILDLGGDKRFEMWFDANANGDLTDDPGPLKKQGSGDGGPGGFATVLRVPWALLAPESGFSGEFEIWFFINKAGWEGKRASHYSRTQLRGEAVVNGRPFRAWVADSGYNDADLTNDGVLIDLNGNGKPDRDEWFADIHADEKRVVGARGRVEVRW